MLKLLAAFATAGGAALGFGALLVGMILPAAYGKDVILISPHAPDVVRFNKESWTEGENVIDVYGIQTGERTRILFADPHRMIIPDQDPSLVLYAVDKQHGENPLQVRSVAFLSRWAALGGLATSIVGLALSYAAKRRAAPLPPEGPVGM